MPLFPFCGYTLRYTPQTPKWTRTNYVHMQAVVPAAGEGTRLRPLTDDKPKGLVEVADRPLLAHGFDRLIELNVDRIVVVIGYRVQQIRDHFGPSYRGTPLRYVTQENRLGLAHAILQAEPHINDEFLVYNGDNVIQGTLQPVVDAYGRSDADAVLLVEDATRETASETGVVTTDDRGTVTGLVEKPDDPPSTLVTTGVYLLPRSIFEDCRAIAPSDREEYELVDAIDRLRRRGGTIQTVTLDGWRCNVNTPNDVEEATRKLGE